MEFSKSSVENLAMNSNSKNILITGGTGFVGGHIIHRLLLAHYSVILLKQKTSNTWRINDIIKQAKTYDINPMTNFYKLLKKVKPKGIIHLAGTYIKIDKSRKDIEELNNSNIIFPTLLLDAAVRNRTEFFINTGTFSEYRLRGIISENTKVEPYNYYSATKVAFESILKYYAQQKKIKAVTLKLFSPYGKRDNAKVIPLICKSFLDGKELALTEGSQELPFTYISDIVDAYIKTLAFIQSKKYKQYETFNIGSNESWSIREIVNRIKNLSEKENKVKFGQLKMLDDVIVHIKCNTEKAKKMLKWQPKVSFDKGLKKTYQYYRNIKNHDKRS